MNALKFLMRKNDDSRTLPEVVRRTKWSFKSESPLHDFTGEPKWLNDKSRLFLSSFQLSL